MITVTILLGIILIGTEWEAKVSLFIFDITFLNFTITISFLDSNFPVNHSLDFDS